MHIVYAGVVKHRGPKIRSLYTMVLVVSDPNRAPLFVEAPPVCTCIYIYIYIYICNLHATATTNNLVSHYIYGWDSK